MVHVGKVWITVAPDLKGFREKVEKELRGLRGMKVQVDPDLDGFRREVKNATKGLKATVDVDLDTKGIKAEAKAAAKAASGEVVSMRSDLDTSWADKELKEWGKRFSKRNATGVTMLQVDVDRDNISNVEDLIHKQVSRTPVNIEMQIRKDRLMQSIRGVQKALRKQVDGQSRYIQLSLGTSPKDSGSQRKMLSYLDQVKARLDKLKKDTSTPWEQWDGKSPIKEFHTSLAELNKDIKALRDADEDSWKLGNLSQYNHKLTDQTRQLKTIIDQHRRLVKESQASGKAFPDGFRKLTEDINKLNQELDLAKKNFGPDFRQFTKDTNELVKRRTRREIAIGSFLDSRAVQETKRQLDNLRKSYDTTAEHISASTEKIREASNKVADGFNGTRVGKEIQAVKQYRRITKNAPGKETLAGTFRESARRVREAASGVRYYAYEMSALKIEAQEAAAANDKVSKSLRNTAKAGSSSRGFGARRKGLRSIDELGTKKFAGLSRVGWIASAIGLVAAPVIQLVSGLVAALPALGGAALAALGVTLLGLEGIKDAAQAAAPALERVKSAVSDVFRERMTSQFEQLGTLLDNISPQLQNMANGMSDFSQGLTDGLTSTTGTANIQKFLDNTAGLFSRMKPFATDFTEGLLEMASAGSETFPSLADGMNRFGDAFRDSIGELSDSGQLQDSIQATYDVVGSFGTNIGRILREGIETSPDMVEGVTTLFDGIADGVIALMGPLSTVSGITFTGIGSALSGLATDIENTTNTLTEYAPNLENSLSRIGTSIANFAVPGGFDSSKGFLENILGAPAITEAEAAALDRFAERFATTLENMQSDLDEATPRFKASMDEMRTAWEDSFFLGDQSEGKNPAVEWQMGASEGIKKWWDEFKMLFSEEGRAKIKEMSEDPELKVGSALTGGPEAGAAGGGIGETISGFFEGIGQALSTAGTTLSEQTSGIFSGMGESISTAFSGIGESISGVFSGISSTVVGSLMGVVSSVTSTLGSLPGTVSGIFSNVSSVMSSSFSGAASAVSGAASSLVGSVSGTLGSLPGTVSGIFSSVMSTMTGLMSSAAASVIGTISGMVSSAVGILASLPGQAQAALGNVGGVLVASGRALVQGFISGITSMIGSVISAASQIAAAARSVFPFSPAKRGPLSGKGYTTYSGKALVKDFAKGIESEVSVARAAATLVAKATQEEFNKFQVNPTGNMEGFKRQQVLQPVLESNAKKIADYRKREAERAEKYNERMGKIDENKSKADKKEEQRAEARKDLAKQSAEAYEKLLESLDTPDYGKIDRSFKSYWMDGYSQVFKETIANAMSSSDFTGALAKSTKGAINQIRQQFGDHPIMSQVEAQVDTDAFHWAVYNAVEEAGIHEIPINLVVSNVDQLKSDLGMGDGVISRALDAVLEYDPAQTDGRRYEEQKKEVHYHVADMEEAIRLEQQRERKEMMKLV